MKVGDFMSISKQRPRISRQISLSPQEDQLIRTRAARAGMSVSAFIKRQALSGSIKTLNLAPLSDHAETIGRIAQNIQIFSSAPHPDRWLYQADWEQIEDQLDTLLTIEKEIQEQIRRRMR